MNARDRIGTGPWYNQAKQMVAANLDQLHNTVTPPNLLLNELGALTARNVHDILTGSNTQGIAIADNCRNWTSANAADNGMVGHVDLQGGGGVQSWNAKYLSPCDPVGMASVGGGGLLFCFRLRR